MIAFIAAATIQCQARSVGPGSLRRGGTSGAACMLAAFKDCHAAGYTLSSFGVDTIRTETFRLAGCKVYVTESFRVVPQQPRVLGRFVCSRLRKTSTGDVVADRCAPQKTISLTKL
ncbi:MAG TPA: hypothetical protein VGG88_00180 [Gaiellaceae bacterium]